jgi:hypothetical protein
LGGLCPAQRVIKRAKDLTHSGATSRRGAEGLFVPSLSILRFKDSELKWGFMRTYFMKIKIATVKLKSQLIVIKF